MKAIILAAGRGTRISRMIQDVPKSTLPINGRPLIKITVDLLERYKIPSIVCVGYEYRVVMEALKNTNVKYVHNPFYNITNSIASLWFARYELDDDLLILNADVFFSDAILEKILQNSYDVVMAIDKSRVITGDYFFSTTGNGCILKYGKDLPLSQRNCEYVGIAKISKSFLPDFTNRMNELIDKGRYDLWWENILYSFTDQKERDIYTVDVGEHFWSEIDYFDDYERILRYIDKEVQHV